jgi:hypothetical protein
MDFRPVPRLGEFLDDFLPVGEKVSYGDLENRG